MSKWRSLLTVVLIGSLSLAGCDFSTQSDKQATSPAQPAKVDPGTPSTPGKVLSDQIQSVRTHHLQNQLPVGLLPSGNIVAYELESAKPNRLHIVSPNGQSVKVVATAAANRNIYNAVIAQDWIVYAEASADMIKADWTIIAVHQDGSESLTVDQGKTSWEDFKMVTPTLIGPELSASGSLIAWSTFEKNETGVRAVVRTFDLKTHEMKSIETRDTKGDLDFGHPKLDGTNLVYDRGRVDPTAGGRHSTVVLRNLQTGEVKELDGGLNYSSPQIQGSNIIWMAGRYDIKLYDMKTQEINTLVKSSGKARWLPSLNQQLVTWHENDTASHAYLLADQSLIEIRSTGTNGGAKVIGSLLYWISNNQGKIVVEWMDLNKKLSTM